MLKFERFREWKVYTWNVPPPLPFFQIYKYTNGRNEVSDAAVLTVDDSGVYIQGE